MRTKYLDPDFRQKPKTRRFCCVCSRDLRGESPARFVLTINDGTEAVHPEDWDSGRAAQGIMDVVGPDCAERIGLEWSEANAF